MPIESVVSKDSPLMKAFEAWKGTYDYTNTRKWAAHDQHVDGSLWAAFIQGWNAAQSEGSAK